MNPKVMMNSMDKTTGFTIVEQPLQRTLPPTYSWSPGFFRRAPWLGILALFSAVGCAFASATIIIVSDHHPATWRFEPSVVLALLSAVTTALLFVVLHSGVTITWWRAALSPRGTSLATLHHIWNHGGGGGLSAAFFAGRNVNKVAIASILIAIASITYSPLLQRASHTKVMALSTNVTKLININKNISGNVGGTIGDDGLAAIDLTFLGAIQEWYRGDKISTWNETDYACNGTCKGFVPSVGVMGDDCSYNTEIIDVQKAARSADTYIFAINFTSYEDIRNIPTLEMTVKGLTDTKNCVGTMVTYVCKMHVGAVKFPITIEGTNITFDSDYSRIFLSEPYAFAGDYSTARPGSPAGPLAALRWFGESYFRANATVRYDASVGGLVSETNGVAARQYYNTSLYSTDPSDECMFEWINPSYDIIAAFNDVLFRSNYYNSSNSSAQAFDAVQVRPTLIYESVYMYLGIGSAILVLSILAVSATLWGWWELGRHVSLSPLETGKALGLLQFPENAVVPPDVHTLVGVMGDTKVRYGETTVFGADGYEKTALGIRPLGVGMDPASPRRAARVNYA